MPKAASIHCDLLVIGRGMAGMAAALFAANRGLSAIQVGMTGELMFASGLLDLLGVHPVQERKSWEDPWLGIQALLQDVPRHPYAHLSRTAIEAAFDEVLSFFEEQGLPYRKGDTRNAQIMTPAGTVKRTYSVPETMWSGVEALKKKAPCLIVDFQGLHDFSARQIVSTLGSWWPQLRSARVLLPDSGLAKDFMTGENTAQRLELSRNRRKLAQALGPLVKDARFVGMPAILGFHRSQEVVADLEKKLGVPVFEVPTLPISVPGQRLHDVFTRGLLAKGIRIFSQYRVLEVNQSAGGDFLVQVGRNAARQTIGADGIILASGRFWGKGLRADRSGIRETIFDLPVNQPGGRSEWHRQDFLDPAGHPANRAGVEIDSTFRPLDEAGRPPFPNLFAAGSILAHQDWMRMKCGSGLAIASAYGAVSSFLKGR